MKISYQCSNCGKREQTSAGVGIPEGMFYLGYRAHGAVYRYQISGAIGPDAGERR